MSFVFLWLTVNAQENQAFGVLTEEDRSFTSYEKDPDAPAVVLYEVGDNYFKEIKNVIRLVKRYHVKIKILTTQGFEQGDINIPYIGSEKIVNLKAVTHNNDSLFHVLPEDIYTLKQNNFVTRKKFAFSKLQVGSIIEYQYEIITPYFFKLDGWDFQADIPKLYSEFRAKIPGSFVYNRDLIGSLALDTNEAKMEPKCFKTSYLRADCEALKYIMRDIPALARENNFALSPDNYSSRLEFELAEIKYSNRRRVDITATWDKIDEDFKKAESIGPQLLKKGFFRRKIPDELLAVKNPLERAKKLYAFIQNHFTWDKTNGTYTYNNVKEAFRNKIGCTAEINMSLINLLNDAGIQSNLMIMSTRQNGLPKRTHPVMYDFNYFVARVEIDGQIYLLDASNKFVPFGMLPFKALNHYGRVMDFKGKGYWYKIKPYPDNKDQIRCQVKFDLDEGIVKGTMHFMALGYNAVAAREAKAEKSENQYLSFISGKIQENVEINSYLVIPERSNETKVSERVEFQADYLSSQDLIFFNPFLARFFEQNPFVEEERNYPVDFGYPRHYKYQINIALPEGYQVQELPKKDVVKLGENMAALKYYHSKSNEGVMISFDLTIDNTYFEPVDYQVLRELFKRVMDIQKNALVVLKKVQ